MDAHLHTAAEFLDMLKVHVGAAENLPRPASDYRVAQVLGVTRASISSIRKGHTGFSDQLAVDIAEILELDPQYVMACCQLERAKKNTQDDRVLELWERIAKSCAMFLFGLAIYAGAVSHEARAEGSEQKYTLCALRGRRRSRLLGWFKGLLGPFLAATLATACSSCPLPQFDNPYQQQAAVLIGAYNAAHHTHLAVPPVDIGATTELAYANDWCPHGGATGCWLVLSSYWVARDPDYVRVHVLPHEVDHDICVQTVTGCTAADHGRDFRRIGAELGLPPDDPYMEARNATPPPTTRIP